MEVEKLVTLNDLDRYKTNPFFDEMALEVRHKTEYYNSESEIIAKSAIDSIKGFNTLARRTKVDPERFVKIYTDTLGIWFELTKTAQKTLMYIMKNMQKDSDKIIIDKEQFQKITGLNSTCMMYKGLGELCNKFIIARSYMSVVYFINPAYIFNGNRFAVLNVYEKESFVDNRGPIIKEQPLQIEPGESFDVQV